MTAPSATPGEVWVGPGGVTAHSQIEYQRKLEDALTAAIARAEALRDEMRSQADVLRRVAAERDEALARAEALAGAESRQSTHSEDCYKWHHECAIAKIERAEKPEPVAWRDHVESRLWSWRQSFVNKHGDRLMLEDFMDRESLDDLIDYVCDEYAHPPTTKQEPT